MKKILDPCCGSKMFWFDKSNPYTIYSDVRKEEHILCDGRKLLINPDMVSDFRQLPFPDGHFKLVVFDPPHLVRAGESSWMNLKYGRLPKDFAKYLSDGFSECWRVLDCNGTLIFKWNETQVRISEILKHFSQKPLFGQTTTQNLKTHWMVFYKND